MSKISVNGKISIENLKTWGMKN